MNRILTRLRLGFPFFLCGFYGAVLAVCSPAAFGQACSSKPLEQGHVCTKPGARCSPVTVGGGDVGKCTIEGTSAEALSCACQGGPISSYNVTMTPLTPSNMDTGVATSTLTVIPFNGFTGKVDFTCSVSGTTYPAPSCTTPPPATITGEASANSATTVTVSNSTAQGTYTVTVTAVDDHGRPPDNGTQSSLVSVTRINWTIGKSLRVGGIVLLIFLAGLTIWGLSPMWRSKRGAPR